MAVDKYGNVVIKKDFWTDGDWYTVFLLLPFFAAWLVLFLILVYGAYYIFRYDVEHIKAGFLFAGFAFLNGLGIMFFGRIIRALLTEKIIFTDERFIYRGFGYYSLPYKSIKHIILREVSGPAGLEKLLFVVSADESGRERFYAIPRWKTLAGGKLSREFSKRMMLSLLDGALLAYYAAPDRRNWLLPSILGFSIGMAVFLFLVARVSPKNIAGVAVFIWLFLLLALIIFFARFIGRKKDMTIGI